MASSATRPGAVGLAASADGVGHAAGLQPGVGLGEFRFRQGVQQVTVGALDAGVGEAPQHRQVGRLVGGQVAPGHAQHEGLVALVGGAVQQRGGLGVGARHDDARHAHHVQLEAGRVETLDLLVAAHQHLAALMAALLLARALVLDVVARHADLHETPDEVAHVRVAAVAGVGVGDDERRVVHLGDLGPLVGAHL